MPLRTLGVLALVAALAVSSCSDDPQPKVAPEPSPSSSSATASPSTEPAASSPEDAIRAWVAARNYALRTGDADGVRALSTSNCTTCDESIRPIEKVHAAGGAFDTAGWRVASTEIRTLADTRAEVDAAIVYAAGRTTPSQGAAPVEYEQEKHIVVFRLHHDQQWRVRFIGYLS